MSKKHDCRTHKKFDQWLILLTKFRQPLSRLPHNLNIPRLIAQGTFDIRVTEPIHNRAEGCALRVYSHSK